jgi:ribonuclease HI
MIEEREKAIKKVINLMERPETVIFTDAAERKKHFGASAVILDRHHTVQSSWHTSIGAKKQWSIHQAELIAISYALDIISSRQERSNDAAFTIVSDSKSALQALAHPSNRSGQWIVRTILKKAEGLQNRGTKVDIHWIPGRSGTPGNDAANKMAKQAAGPEERHCFRRPLTSQKQQNRIEMLQKWQKEWQTTEKGKHLRRIDHGLPSKHTLKLYGSRQRSRVYTLMQLRSRHSWLADHAKIRSFREDDRCACGARETVVHVLVDCPDLRELRKELRDKIGDAFNDISTMLGGKPQDARKRKGWTINAEVVDAVLDFAQASQRFQSRQEDGSQVRDRRQMHNPRP